jgi:hypothetical protein
MGEELTIVNSAISKHGGGVRAELRRALKAGSTVGHLAMARRWATLGRLGEEEGSPPPRWVRWIVQPMADWARSQEIILSELNKNF